MNNRKLILVLNFIFILNACATSPKSILMGAVAGSIVGAGLGQAQSRNSEGTTVGAAVGLGLGSLIGYLSFIDQQKTNANDKNEKPEDIAPFLTKPKIRSYIVPDSIEGNKYIKSHRVFILEDPGSWSR
ncbi:MAG: hypothetical protein A4S09_06495 [Proteobacteria bacterium SG_bin7]|nr:MAG: hypothetical protein A4S09_06495 [Proteobacteria bacterium SG_bin7]